MSPQTVIKGLDAANARLESTMDVLRSTMAESALRPTGEEPRSLLDFIEESSIEATRDALKESIRESKVDPTKFPLLHDLMVHFRTHKLSSIPLYLHLTMISVL